MGEKGKVYINIIKEINSIIHEDELLPGHKLPSERELADRLNAGRSSVREALRALELLDLIETRKGEGTFIRRAGGHKLAEILASYFLRDEGAREDVTETRRIIEVEAVRLACRRRTQDQLKKLEQLLETSAEKWSGGVLPVEEDYLFHKTLVEASQNRLMLNMWRPLVEYSKVALEVSLGRKGRPENAIQEHRAILQGLLDKDEDAAVRSLKGHLENSRF